MQSRPEDTRGRPSAPPVESLERVGRWSAALLARPRVRTLLVGVALILIGALVVTHSVWTLPLVLIGIVMVVVAWVGSRLEGRFAIEWSSAGAGFELRARFAAAHRSGTVPLPLPAPAPPHAEPPAVESSTVASAESSTPGVAVTVTETIEGTAHTEEIDAVELSRLVELDHVGHDSATGGGAIVSWRENAA